MSRDDQRAIMAPHLVLSNVQIEVEVEVEVEAAAVEVLSRRGSRALPRYALDNEPTVSAGSFFSRENMLYRVLRNFSEIIRVACSSYLTSSTNYHLLSHLVVELDGNSLRFK